MNCLFFCIFNKTEYVDMFFVLLKSLKLYGNLDENTDILIYTNTLFMEMIKENELYYDKIKFQINDEYKELLDTCRSRLDIFNFEITKKYEKICYLDTDIIIKGDLNRVFDLAVDDRIYDVNEAHGNYLFGDEINNYEDTTAFTSGILLFRNCDNMRFLFEEIKKDIIKRPFHSGCYDQPYVIYNAFKYKLYNNKILCSLAANCCFDHKSQYAIHHFPGGVGIHQDKIHNMRVFLYHLENNL